MLSIQFLLEGEPQLEGLVGFLRNLGFPYIKVSQTSH